MLPKKDKKKRARFSNATSQTASFDSDEEVEQNATAKSKNKKTPVVYIESYSRPGEPEEDVRVREFAADQIV